MRPGFAAANQVVTLTRVINKVSPPGGGGRRADMPLPDSSSAVAYRVAADQSICVSPLIQKSRRIYVRPRTGPQSAHLWWLSCRQPACLYPRQLRHATGGRTDGRITLFQNVP